jgi:hypothetical protein
MPIILDKELYELAKIYIYSIYKKNSAYRSMAIQKLYKSLGGRFADDNKEKKLSSWMKEKWTDIGHKSYPVYRPTIHVNSRTPLTVNEIDENNLQQQIKLKQKIRGSKNLPKFIKKS